MPVYQKIIVGILAATIAAILQLLLWGFLSPLIWILFYPAAFIAAGIGGLVSGLTAGLTAIFYVYLIFVEPTFVFSIEKLNVIRTAILFMPIIYLIGNLQERNKKLRDGLASALKVSEEDKAEVLALYEKNIALSEIKFTDFADSLPQIVWATDPAGKNIYFNHAWMEYTGMTLQESLGDGWNKPFHPDDQARAWEAWKNATEKRAEYSLECRLKKADGTYHWWLIRGIPVVSYTGKILRWFGTCTDIEGMKKAYNDLAAEKSKLESIFNSSPDGLAIVDRDGKFTIFNDRFISYFGLKSRADFVYDYQQLTEMLDVLTPAERSLPKESYPVARALAGETVIAEEILFKNKATGHQWYGSHSAAPIRDADGTIIGVVTVVRDVTARVESEKRLLTLLNDQQLMLNTGVIGIAKTKGRTFQWVNDAFAKNFGYATKELIGQSSQILYADNEAFDTFGQKIAESNLGEARSIKETLKLKKKDGSIGWFLTGGGPVVKGGDDYIWMSLDVTQDLTNQKLMENYLHRLERSMKETLILLSKTVEMHDPYTAGHQLRVGEIAAGIGKIMGLSEHQNENLKLMGLIHDIGKIGVPADILSKPGRLSDEEMALVRSHTKIGYEILKDVDFDIPVADVARGHHERLDGSGYPRGLHDEDISIESRIIAVADVLEAMSSHRPYRPSLGLDRAIDELMQGRGIKYDAQVVDACIKFLEVTGWKPGG